MAKVSRPIIYAALAGVVGYAAFILTEPDAPVKKKTTAAKKTASVADAGFTDADYKAHFARYAQPVRDAFKPEIMPKKAETATAAPAAKKQNENALTGNWALTGISAINGVPSALLENGATHESVFVKQGDLWNGLRVVAIETDSAVLRNAQGKMTRLTFTAVVPTPNGNDGQNPAGSAPAAPDNSGPAPAAPANSTSAALPQPAPAPETPAQGEPERSPNQP